MDLNVGLDHYCGGKVGRDSNMQAYIAPASTCFVNSRQTKVDTFEGKRLITRTLAKSGRVTIYLDRSVSVEYITDTVVNLKNPVKFWSYLLPRVFSCDIKDIEELVTFLDGSSKRRGDFITPKKKLKVDESIIYFSLSFLVDVFKGSDPNTTSFDSL